MLELVPVPTCGVSSDANSLADTEILSSSSSIDKFTQEVFYVPKFSGNVEYRLRQGNLLYMRDGTYLNVKKDMKHEILERLAETIVSEMIKAELDNS